MKRDISFLAPLSLLFKLNNQYFSTKNTLLHFRTKNLKSDFYKQNPINIWLFNAEQ